MSEQNYNLAFVFPGQGSQSMGMLKDLADSYPIVTQIFEQASDALSFDLWQLVQHDNDALNETHNTQPAMLAAGVAVWKVWCQQNTLRPAWMAGHSLGEYTALVCSEAMDFEETIRLVALRGQFMQQAVPAGTGAMAAILGLEDRQVVNVCESVAENEIVAAVNFNSVGQVVIAGHQAAVERAMVAAKEAGARRAVKLPISVPSHCDLMKPAAEQLALELEKISIKTPKMTLIHNVDVIAHSDEKVIRNALKEQLFKPVRWVDSIQFMHDQGVNTFVEAGPGKVLLGLNKRIVKSASHFTMYDSESLERVLEQLNG